MFAGEFRTVKRTACTDTLIGGENGSSALEIQSVVFDEPEERVSRIKKTGDDFCFR